MIGIFRSFALLMLLAPINSFVPVYSFTKQSLAAANSSPREARTRNDRNHRDPSPPSSTALNLIKLQGALFNFGASYEFAKTPREILWEWFYDDGKRFEYAKDQFRCVHKYQDDSGDMAYELEARSELPVTLKFTQTTLANKTIPFERLEYSAKGDLEGGGSWEFADRPGGGTVATYTWNVRLNHPMLMLLSYVPFIRTAAEKNHDVLMVKGRKDLGELIDDPPPE